MSHIAFAALTLACTLWASISVAKTPSINEANGKFCIPLAVSPTRDAISFSRRYKLNASRFGLKRTDLNSIDRDGHHLVTTDKSSNEIREMAAEQVSMGLVSNVYRLEEKFVGSKTLYVLSPEISTLIYGDGEKHYLHKSFSICLGDLAEQGGYVVLDPLISTKTEMYLKAKLTHIKFTRLPHESEKDELLESLPQGLIAK
ncbi:hypothetical protein CL689_06770 [Candidatus Saccharibacteria bacterium]|nr:hypothetical protein [Candidatus Saccharibacteria bacterium]|tara:strand:- start:3267 stop:3869 length:603 start_codon:yes stop_codon:yes gene_type:complete